MVFYRQNSETTDSWSDYMTTMNKISGHNVFDWIFHWLFLIIVSGFCGSHMVRHFLKPQLEYLGWQRFCSFQIGEIVWETGQHTDISWRFLLFCFYNNGQNIYYCSNVLGDKKYSSQSHWLSFSIWFSLNVVVQTVFCYPCSFSKLLNSIVIKGGSICGYDLRGHPEGVWAKRCLLLFPWTLP